MRRFHPNHNKSSENSSFFRYFKARFQPFRRPLFWGSIGGLSLLVVCVWQYWQHPEWLGTTVEQPGTSVDNPIDPSLSDPLASPGELPPSTQNELDSLLEVEANRTAEPEEDSSPQEQPKNLLEQLAPKEEKEAKTGGSAKIFPDLVPDQNSASDNKAFSDQNLIERASFDNVRSLFEGKPSNQASPSNFNSSGTSAGSAPNLPSVEPVPVPPSPLEQAVERAFSNPTNSSQNSPVAEPETATPNPTPQVPEAEAPNPRPNFAESSIGRTGYEQYGTVPVVPNSSYPAPAASPTAPSYAPGQGQNPYGQPNPSSVPSGAGSGQPQAVPEVTPQEQLDSFNFNNSFNSFSPSNQVPQRQFNQPNQNASPPSQNGVNGGASNPPGVQSPQFEQPIQVEQPGFSDSPF